MIKNSSMILSIIGATTLAVFSMTAPVQAKKAGDWTCEDFLKVPKSSQSRVVYWMVGVNKSQMKEAADVTAKDFNVPVSQLVQYCHTNLPQNLWQAIADHFYWHAMQIP
jgi:hypothetical protein